jgi:hypothetical protein
MKIFANKHWIPAFAGMTGINDKESRRKVLVVSFLLAIYLLLIPAFLWQKSSEKELSLTQAKSRELSVLAAEYEPIKKRLDTIEQKKSLTKTTGITQAIDDIVSAVGIKGKIKSMKGTAAGVNINRLREESAEIQMEKLTMNEMVHLFYNIEHAPMILAIKKAQIRKTFENPERLDITMTLSLFTGKEK